MNFTNHYPAIFFMSFIVLFQINTQGQSQKISGIINTYSQVLLIDTSDVKTKLKVVDKSGFKIGDKLLVIQMKGAVIDSSNSANFGNIIDLRGAGTYEFVTLSFISGNLFILSDKLTNKYEVEGKVQVVTVPKFSSVTITDTLKAKPWDGTTGGIIAFTAKDDLILEANIDASGIGYRGGHISNNPDGYCSIVPNIAYFYPLHNTEKTWKEGGAMKGEGIAEVSLDKYAGKGALANGGGGGSKHNAGGGGGGNFTKGGQGGNEIALCDTAKKKDTKPKNGGIGGNSLEYMNTKIFMGGGGGCGDFNNGMGTTGTTGGGIIIIKANRVIGNGRTICANGVDQVNESHTIGDGSGGGGAGGSILLDVKNYETELKIEANGGKGGNQSPSALVACIGPGGGGGTGIIISRQVLPETVRPQMRPGASGLILNPDLPCYKTGYGAMEGEISVINYYKDEYAIGNRIKVLVKHDTLMIEEFKIMKNLKYLQSKHYLIDHSRNELSKLAIAMRKYNSLEIELSGHTDYVGNPQLNLELSEKRVLFAKNFLLRQGIEEKRIQVKSHGGAAPLVNGDVHELRDKNRRVEIKVLKY